MEENSDLEHVSGSSTGGESGFVHVESIESASMDGSAINQQDDGVVVTRVDTVEDESSDLRMTDDGGNEEFVDCPDDLLSYDGRTDVDESQEAEVVSEDNQHTLFDSKSEILPHHYQEERQQLMTELTNLRHKLKVLIKKNPLIDGNDGTLFTYELAAGTVAGDDKSLWPLHEMIFDCSRFIELALGEQSQTEHTVRDLHATLDTKDKEINDLNVKVFELSSVETTTDRILSSLANVLSLEEFPDTSVSGKILHLENITSFLVQKHSHVLSEVQMLNQCLTELKRKELELTHKSSYLEDEYRKLMEQLNKGKETIAMLNSEIGRLKGEVEIEKTRYSNTREKLNLAVTKGKSLVQQRDSLKQAIVEKTSELDKCLFELQEKSSALETAELRKKEMAQFEALANSLKDQSSQLQDEINTMKEAARLKIDRLTISLLIEAQEKNYLEEEFADLTQKVSKELCVLKDKNGHLKIDLQRSEDKAALLREKLSMAVKKGKALVQERESMKQEIAEKNANIEALNLELKQQEEQISKLSSDVERIIKLESDLLHSKEERDQTEQFLIESNTILQQIIDATDEIVLPVDITEPLEKVRWCASHLNECQVSKAQVEQELRDLKDEASMLASKLTDSLEAMKSLEDALSVSEKHVFQLTEEKRELEILKINIEEGLHNAMEECHILKTQAEKTITTLTEQKQELEVAKSYIEEKLHKAVEEATSQTSKFEEIVASRNSLQEMLSLAEKNISVLMQEKEAAQASTVAAERELQNVKDEVSTQLQAHISQFSHENEMAQNNRNLLESEIKKLKDETSYHEQKFLDASITIRSLEDALLNANNTVSNLLGEKKNAEKLHKAVEEATSQTSKFEEIVASRNSLQEMLSLAEKNISVLMQEKEDAQASTIAAKRELQNVKDELSTQLQAHISQFSQENEMAQNNRNLLESEIKKLKDETSYHEQKFLDASITIRTLEDALLNANNTVSNLLGEKKNAEQEISTRGTQLDACRQELACKHDDWASDFSSFLENLQVLLKDGTLLILFNQSIEKKIEIFIEMDHHLKDIKDYFDSERLQDYPAIEESFHLSTLLPTRFDNILNTETTNDNGADATNIKSYAGKTLEKLNMRNQILTDEFIRFSTFIDELTTSLLLKLEAIKNTVPITLEQTKTLQKSVHDLQIDKQVQEKKILIISTEITELQAELEKTRSKYDKVKEENNMLQNRVSKLDTELEASQTMRDELGNKLQDYQAKEDEWDRREAELSKQLTSFIKDHDAENKKGVTEASQLPPHSEISEVEDPVSIGKRSMPLARTLRRGSNDHLTLNIDPESDHLIGKEETLQDKGHVFKSLHTSGLVPPQGKIIADRLDGIWVSGGGALMSRPRARLGLIAYWLVLHLWLVGTLL